VAIYGEKHYQVAIVYNNLAGWAFVTGDLETSEQQFAKAVELFDQTLGEHHPRTKLARKNLNFLRSKKQ
jgi:Flp pilus assembly protein TadD